MNDTSPACEYSTITERPGDGAHREQLSALITRYHFAAAQCGGSVVDVVELGVTVHVLGALFLFRSPLEAIAHLGEQGTDRPRADRKALGFQCPGDVVGRLGGPTKR